MTQRPTWQKMAVRLRTVTGEEVRRAREAAGISRKILARDTGVSERTLIRIENEQDVSSRSLEPVLRYLRLGAYGSSDDSAAGPPLRDATDVELLAELARRISVARDVDRDLPPVPQVRVAWPRTEAPSQRRIRETGETTPQIRTTP